MKNLFLLFVIVSTSFCFSQESPSALMNNLCKFETDGTGKSLGLKIKFVFPCLWEGMDGNRPHILKKFNYSIDGNSIRQIITIRDIQGSMSQRDIALMLSSEGMRNSIEGLGTYLNSRKITIDGIETGEITYKAEQESAIGRFYMYCLYYIFIYDGKLISMTFFANSTTDLKAEELFNKYKLLFYLLAGKTIVISQWEK